MSINLSTTNVFLGIMAAVSLLQAIGMLGVFVAAFVLYRHVLRLVDSLEQRQISPTVARVNAILDDVKDVTSIAKNEAEHVDRLIEVSMDAFSLWRRRQDASIHGA